MPNPQAHFALNWPASIDLPFDGFMPDLSKSIINSQYEDHLLKLVNIPQAHDHFRNTLTLQLGGDLGNGEYR
jgi:hypothetical protein